MGAERRGARCDTAPGGFPDRSLLEKKVLTWCCIYGAVSVVERVWKTPRHKYLRVFKEQAGITPRGCSRRLERAMCDFGVESSFAKSCLRLREHYGIESGPSAVREATLFHAARAQKILEARYAENFRALPKNGPAYIIVQTDGTMIRTVARGRKRKEKRELEWKEMRLSAACAQGSKKVNYAAGFTSVEQTGRRMAHCARDAGWALESRIHHVGDGAEWITLQSREIFGEQSDFLLDFYHASEYLAAAAPSCRPGAEKSWLRTQQKRLKRGAAQLVLKAMSEHEESATTPEEEAPVRTALRYLSRRSEQLDYKAAIAKELPIGSGLIESGHKHVLQARLKQTGSAWNPENAHAIAQLRVLRSNSLWDDFWQHDLAA
jgi:hypothetical protein